MKKILSIMVVLLMLFVILAGCATAKPVNNGQPTVSGAPNSTASSGGKVTTGGSPSDSYNAYLKIEGNAIDRVTKKISDNSDLAMSVGMTVASMGMSNLALLPLTVLSAGDAGAQALEILGLNGVTVKQNGQDYTITYSDKSGNKTVQTCKYDPATDSMQSSITDSSGNESMFFEYVKTSNGYASQTYTKGDSGYTLYTSFFNDTNLTACGTKTTDTKPDSIFGKTSLTVDSVKGGDSYFILQGDKLTVFDNGETKTY